MIYFPIPVIIVSSITAADKQAAIKALEIGAFDVVNKPGGALSVGEIVDDIVYKIHQAYEVRESYVLRRTGFSRSHGEIKPLPSVNKVEVLSTVETTEKICCIGASTGGTVALEFLFQHFPKAMPPILVVQHMPANFTRQFADRLNDLSFIEVKEAEDNEPISGGMAYIAPGGYHIVLERRGSTLYIRLTTTEKVHYQRPAVDVLFYSAAAVAGRNVVAALLTGMGRDGAEGLLDLRKAGAHTIAQDEGSSVVWGMPRAAIEMEAAEEILPLEEIAKRLVELAKL
jgi:two-component system chemotaxis response regulator CheB